MQRTIRSEGLLLCGYTRFIRGHPLRHRLRQQESVVLGYTAETIRINFLSPRQAIKLVLSSKSPLPLTDPPFTMPFKSYFFSGPWYIRVTRGDTGPGTQDPGYPKPISAWGWPKGFGSGGIDAALYSGSKCYFFKGPWYVRVTRGTEGPGSQDFDDKHHISEWGWPDGFGSGGIDAALWSGPVTYFFSGQSYIRVLRGDDDFGTPDGGIQPLSDWPFPRFRAIGESSILQGM
jgi:hypothetical protein